MPPRMSCGRFRSQNAVGVHESGRDLQRLALADRRRRATADGWSFRSPSHLGPHNACPVQSDTQLRPHASDARSNPLSCQGLLRVFLEPSFAGEVVLAWAVRRRVVQGPRVARRRSRHRRREPAALESESFPDCPSWAPCRLRLPGGPSAWGWPGVDRVADPMLDRPERPAVWPPHRVARARLGSDPAAGAGEGWYLEAPPLGLAWWACLMAATG